MTVVNRLQRWRRNDWPVPVTLRTPAGPFNLTGYQIGAEFTPGGQYALCEPYARPQQYTWSDLTVSNGGIDSIDAQAGTFRILVPRSLTARCAIDVDASSMSPTFAQLYFIDPYGLKQTFGVVAFSVFDGPLTPQIDETSGVIVLWQDAAFTIELGLSQGPSGPSSIAAGQITDAGTTGIALLRSGTAAAARGLLSTIAVGATDLYDQDYTATSADFFLRVQLLTKSRTITLPDPSLYPKGQTLKIADFTGACSPLLPIVVAAPQDATICGHQSFTLVCPFQRAELDHDGKDTWLLNTLLGQVGHYQYKKAINANTTTAAAGGVDAMMAFLEGQDGYKPGCDAASALHESSTPPGCDFELLVLYPWLEASSSASPPGAGLSATSTPTLADVQAQLRNATLSYTAGGVAPASFFGFFG